MHAARSSQGGMVGGPREARALGSLRERNSARAALLALGLAACAGPPPLPLPDAPPPAPGALRVRLVFGAEADLDLYATGPSQATVYFANSPAGGGELDGDRRCDDPAPRVETATFARAAPGRYRIGVDFPERCARGADEVEYLLIFEALGRRQERRGRLAAGHFEPRALEVDLGP
jgi:hypothetical protein